MSSKVTRYVVGFLFDHDGDEVVLIKKNRPAWMKGLWNGVGGHVEDNETDYEAMVREFKEETGVLITTWTPFSTVSHPPDEDAGYSIVCFKAFAPDGVLYLVKNTTDEAVAVKTWRTCLDAVNPDTPVVKNLQWLIPLALDKWNPVATVVQ